MSATCQEKSLTRLLLRSAESAELGVQTFPQTLQWGSSRLWFLTEHATANGFWLVQRSLCQVCHLPAVFVDHLTIAV